MLDAKHSAEERGKVQSEWLARREWVTSEWRENTIKKGVFAYENDLYGCGGGLRTKETRYEGVRTSAIEARS